jgi:hypothetical protein
VNHTHELKTPFKSQTELLEYVRELAKDTTTVFKLVGLPLSGLYERWEDLASTSIVDMLEERVAALNKHEEALGGRVDALISASQDVASDCDRLNDELEHVIRMLDVIHRSKAR